MASRGPLPPVPNVVKITMSGLANPFPWKTALHYTYTGPPPNQTAVNQFALVTRQAWAGQIASLMINTTSLTATIVTDLSSNTGNQGEDLTVVPGTRGNDNIPANAAALINYPSQQRVRGGHPRNFLLVGGNADNLDAAHWTGAFTLEVQNKWRTFTGDVGGATSGGTTLSNQCYISYFGKYRPNVPPTNYPAPLVFPFPGNNSGVCEQQIASQKRRIGRR